MISAVRKLIVLSDNCSFRILMFLTEYRENVTSLQAPIRFASTTWVGLHPRARPTIVAISVLPILGVRELMCPTIDHLLYALINQMSMW
jgi:hypothetical protein